ncbi:hypothetical protein [Enterobacter ludwigii]|uniref:hypothetical protein n=1 Tax=Enterobacter ludwigii TaxID=299767 RepID=UPI003F727877
MTEVVAGIRELVAVVSEGEGYSGGEPDNAERSALAAEILCYFATRTGLADTLMVDLVTDLMHLCDRLDIDFAGVLNVAAMHHEAERGDG